LTATGARTRQRGLDRFPAWLDRVNEELDGDPENVLETMRLLEAALRAALESPPD
jgi:hypothetical protein